MKEGSKRYNFSKSCSQELYKAQKSLLFSFLTLLKYWRTRLLVGSHLQTKQLGLAVGGVIYIQLLSRECCCCFWLFLAAWDCLYYWCCQSIVVIVLRLLAASSQSVYYPINNISYWLFWKQQSSEMTVPRWSVSVPWSYLTAIIFKHFNCKECWNFTSSVQDSTLAMFWSMIIL